MFTGIIEAVGHIAAVADSGGDKRLTIDAGALDMSAVKLGDSIATNGVCLTVTSLSGSRFTADVSRETLSLATLGDLKVGAPVNLERAMPANGRFDGHIVSGHIDGTGEVISRAEDARSIRLSVAVPESLRKYTAHKGSICIDGVSLTINALSDDGVELNIVPHTAAETIITHYQSGTKVNLEVDVIARYLERLLLGGQDGQEQRTSKQKASRLSEGFLAEHGFTGRKR
ncbi:riboflavin synthase [Litorivivens lipolytica]|uniref:Riboflavin synthase n=1 Tax=Litorivivens lipolytica TaxID=1524264 RepID=A0A7W4W4T7_9GAMM|nr:riboflavin synthase [Litorivivens lipolytica]MBB3047340.1 riboflavin synthase [Litorivivens lipolytica]